MRVRISSVRRPESRRENSLAAEDAEVIRLRDGSRDMVIAAIFIFGDGHLHAGKFGVNLALQPPQDIDGSMAQLAGKSTDCCWCNR